MGAIIIPLVVLGAALVTSMVASQKEISDQMRKINNQPVVIVEERAVPEVLPEEQASAKEAAKQLEAKIKEEIWKEREEEMTKLLREKSDKVTLLESKLAEAAFEKEAALRSLESVFKEAEVSKDKLLALEYLNDDIEELQDRLAIIEEARLDLMLVADRTEDLAQKSNLEVEIQSLKQAAYILTSKINDQAEKRAHLEKAIAEERRLKQKAAEEAARSVNIEGRIIALRKENDILISSVEDEIKRQVEIRKAIHEKKQRAGLIPPSAPLPLMDEQAEKLAEMRILAKREAPKEKPDPEVQLLNLQKEGDKLRFMLEEEAQECMALELELAGLKRKPPVKRPLPEPEPNPEPEAKTPEPVTAKASEEPVQTPSTVADDYEIKSGDTLWGIAAKPDVYGDPNMWPIIYKYNISKLDNPNVIHPGLDLSIPRGLSEEEKADAISKARSVKGQWDTLKDSLKAWLKDWGIEK